MISRMNAVALVACAAAVAGCAMVRQSDLDAWAGAPVEALDTHTFFLTLPMTRTFSASGIEIRNYSNGGDVTNCTTTGTTGRYSNAYTNCTTSRSACHNIFYIKDGRVLRYVPTGRCRTAAFLRPQM